MQKDWKGSLKVALSSRRPIEKKVVAWLASRAAGALAENNNGAWHIAICRFLSGHPSAPPGAIEKSMFKDASSMGFSNSLRVIEIDLFVGGSTSHHQVASHWELDTFPRWDSHLTQHCLPDGCFSPLFKTAWGPVRSSSPSCFVSVGHHSILDFTSVVFPVHVHSF